MTQFVAVVQGFPAHIRLAPGTPHAMRCAADKAENHGPKHEVGLPAYEVGLSSV
jgi:hypothetical protein